MDRIEPSSFLGPRAYFTNFDYRILRRIRNPEKLRGDIERDLKILLLTKGTVVCAASHLTSPFVYRFFQDNPDLLRCGVILPALRRDKSGFPDVFAKTRLPKTKVAEMAGFYATETARTVNWDLEENSTWLKDSFLRELRSEDSVLRRNLKGISRRNLELLQKEMESRPLLERSQIDRVVKDFPASERAGILNFRELLYHMSGARVVNCESTLPQENYIDYSLADMASRKSLLSEMQIFKKMLLELAFETIHRAAVPVEVLDALTFKDILAIREPIERSTFRAEYENLVKKSVAAIERTDPSRILFDMEELVAIQEHLRKSFSKTLEQELKAFVDRRHLTSGRSLLKNTMSLGLGLLGFNPALATAAGIGGLAMETPSWLWNLRMHLVNRQALSDYGNYLEAKKKLLSDRIRQSEIPEKAQLLEVVNLLMEMAAVKLIA